MSKIRYIVSGINPGYMDTIVSQIKHGVNDGIVVLREPVPDVEVINESGRSKKITFGEFIYMLSNELEEKGSLTNGKD